ncbi:MAG TPA: hypothetical protein GXZ45_13895 [Propionibacterium sp.]|nr:hypothetical protein [Propionibacterium sp.]
MSIPFVVEELRDRYYLVRGTQDGDATETRVFVDPAVQSGLALDGVPPEDVVRVTIDFLLERQRIDDLPTQVDLEDVAAAYEEFETHLREQLGSSGA